MSLVIDVMAHTIHLGDWATDAFFEICPAEGFRKRDSSYSLKS